MKKPCIHAFVCIPILLSSCSSLKHQVDPSAPHAVIRLVEPPMRHEGSPVITMMDGGKPRMNEDYRMRPGRHDVVVECIKITTRRSDPIRWSRTLTSESDSVQAGIAFGAGFYGNAGTGSPQGPMSVGVDSMHTEKITRHIQLEAGGRYEYDGVVLNRVGAH